MLINGYSDLSVSRAGVRSDIVCDLKWGAYFKFDSDIRKLFPYINAAVSGARYRQRPLHVSFEYKQVQCTLYPQEAMAAPFSGRETAVEYINALICFLNELYDRRNQLEPDHRRRHEPASIVDIIKALPRTNCQKCGYATCMAFAAALRKGESQPHICPDFASPIAIYAVYPVFGSDGTLTSTFTIESEGAADHNYLNSRPEQKITAAHHPRYGEYNQQMPLYDSTGIRIQTDLTSREIEVLRHVAEGASNPEISERLHISPHTVKSHIIHIFNKLNVNDRTQAAVWATRNQVI